MNKKELNISFRADKFFEDELDHLEGKTKTEKIIKSVELSHKINQLKEKIEIIIRSDEQLFDYMDFKIKSSLEKDCIKEKLTRKFVDSLSDDVLFNILGILIEPYFSKRINLYKELKR